MGFGTEEERHLLTHRKNNGVYSFNSLLRRAVVEPDTKDGPGLKKCLTAIDLIAYGVGSTVGAGIFVTVGEVASGHAGPAVLISFLSAAFACLISAFCYAEFAARIPMSGSAYSFTYVALGEFVGWLYVLPFLFCISMHATILSLQSHDLSLYISRYYICICTTQSYFATITPLFHHNGLPISLILLINQQFFRR
jgi:amino acid transporter